jgi:hypothetical protein
MEIWKDIKGFEGFYQVSNLGNVRSLDRVIIEKNSVRTVKRKGVLLKLGYDEKGYNRIYLTKNCKKKTLKVHRLVAQHFLEKKENKKEVNHKDGDKNNNKVSNLEWCNRRENMIHYFTKIKNKQT